MKKIYTIADKEEAKKLIGRKVKVVECGGVERVYHVNKFGELNDITEYTFWVSIKDSTCTGCTAFQLVFKTLDDVEVGDVLVGSISKYEYQVQARLGDLIAISIGDTPDKHCGWMTINEIKEGRYTLKDSEPEEVLEVTLEETAQKFGVKAVKIIDKD